MDLLLLQLLSPYMKRIEIARCCLLNKLTRNEFCDDLNSLRRMEKLPNQKLIGSTRFVAASRASQWWRSCVQRQWLNRVAYDAAHMHAFPHRTETNYPPLRRHFRGGIDGIRRIRATIKYVTYSDTEIACPECETCPVTMALWTQVGERVVRSTPQLHIGCRHCIFSHSRWSHDIGWITSLTASGRLGELSWYRVDADYDERTYLCRADESG